MPTTRNFSDYQFKLLRDRHGIYGVGFLGDTNCELALNATNLKTRPPLIILRPDCICLSDIDPDHEVTAYEPIEPTFPR